MARDIACPSVKTVLFRFHFPGQSTLHSLENPDWPGGSRSSAQHRRTEYRFALIRCPPSQARTGEDDRGEGNFQFSILNSQFSILNQPFSGRIRESLVNRYFI